MPYNYPTPIYPNNIPGTPLPNTPLPFYPDVERTFSHVESKKDYSTILFSDSSGNYKIYTIPAENVVEGSLRVFKDSKKLSVKFKKIALSNHIPEKFLNRICAGSDPKEITIDVGVPFVVEYPVKLEQGQIRIIIRLMKDEMIELIVG